MRILLFRAFFRHIKKKMQNNIIWKFVYSNSENMRFYIIFFWVHICCICLISAPILVAVTCEVSFRQYLLKNFGRFTNYFTLNWIVWKASHLHQLCVPLNAWNKWMNESTNGWLIINGFNAILLLFTILLLAVCVFPFSISFGIKLFFFSKINSVVTRTLAWLFSH